MTVRISLITMVGEDSSLTKILPRISKNIRVGYDCITVGYHSLPSPLPSYLPPILVDALEPAVQLAGHPLQGLLHLQELAAQPRQHAGAHTIQGAELYKQSM